MNPSATIPRLSPAPRVYLVGKEVEKALIDLGESKAWFARQVGDHPSLLSKYLNGERDMPRDKAVLFAYVLQVPIDRIAVDRHTCPHCNGSLVAA